MTGSKDLRYISLTIPCLLHGGTEMQTLMLSDVMRSYGHPVSVVCYFEYDIKIVDEFKATGATVKLLEMDRRIGFLKFILKLRREIKLISPDILHVQYMAPGALPVIAARLAGVKRIYATVHQPWTRSHGLFSKLILRTVSRLTTKFIAVSLNAERSWFGSAEMFDEDRPMRLQPRHFTIHNAVDADKIKEITEKADPVELQSQLNIPGNAIVIGAVSRLRHEKCIDMLIEAFRLLAKTNVDVHLLIVGSGPDEDKLKMQTLEAGIEDSVTFYGSALWEKAIELISVMDIVVVPSRFEGFSLTAAEAMAAGKPVVASDTSGLKEVVINEITGKLFPVDDAEALKLSLDHLLKDSGMREHMGNSGRSRVNEKFSIGLYANKIAALYNLNIDQHTEI